MNQQKSNLFLDNYTFVSKYKPFTHQVETVNFLLQNRSAFCFNEIGTGKTAALIWAADLLMNLKAINKVLILAPLSTLKIVWDKALFEIAPHRTTSILYGSKEARLKNLKNNVDFYIINHDGIKVIYDDLLAREDIDLVIVDESSIFRKSSADRYKALRGLCKHRNIWCATGSPTPNSPVDIWPTARLVCPQRVPPYFSHFRAMTMYQATTFVWKPKNNWQDIIKDMIQPAIRFTRDDCLDIPPVIFEDREIELSPQQKKVYKEILTKFQSEIAGIKVTAINEAAKRIKLLQVVSGAVYDDSSSASDVDCKPRLKVLEECLEESSFKAIVFVPFKNIQQKIADFIRKELERSCEIVNGETSLKERTSYFHDFQNNNLDILIAHPKCMGYGLDLTASSTIIWWSPVDDNDVYMQANGRITRPTQKNKQLIIHFSSTDLERMIYERLKNKQSMQNVLLEYIKNTPLS